MFQETSPIATHPGIYIDRDISIIRANVNFQGTIKHARFKITEIGTVENGEKYLLATSCDYGLTILLIKLLDAFFSTATLDK